MGTPISNQIEVPPATRLVRTLKMRHSTRERFLRVRAVRENL
jgi:hypothetical protein